MNDFTKEELETLLGVLNIFYHSNNFINDELEGYLRIKIQSLIDKYRIDEFIGEPCRPIEAKPWIISICIPGTYRIDDNSITRIR